MGGTSAAETTADGPSKLGGGGRGSSVLFAGLSAVIGIRVITVPSVQVRVAPPNFLGPSCRGLTFEGRRLCPCPSLTHTAARGSVQGRSAPSEASLHWRGPLGCGLSTSLLHMGHARTGTGFEDSRTCDDDTANSESQGSSRFGYPHGSRPTLSSPRVSGLAVEAPPRARTFHYVPIVARRQLAYVPLAARRQLAALSLGARITCPFRLCFLRLEPLEPGAWPGDGGLSLVRVQRLDTAAARLSHSHVSLLRCSPYRSRSALMSTRPSHSRVWDLRQKLDERLHVRRWSHRSLSVGFPLRLHFRGRHPWEEITNFVPGPNHAVTDLNYLALDALPCLE